MVDDDHEHRVNAVARSCVVVREAPAETDDVEMADSIAACEIQRQDGGPATPVEVQAAAVGGK